MAKSIKACLCLSWDRRHSRPSAILMDFYCLFHFPLRISPPLSNAPSIPSPSLSLVGCHCGGRTNLYTCECTFVCMYIFIWLVGYDCIRLVCRLSILSSHTLLSSPSLSFLFFLSFLHSCRFPWLKPSTATQRLVPTLFYPMLPHCLPHRSSPTLSSPSSPITH